MLENELKEALKNLEKLKQNIMRIINKMNCNEQSIRRTTVYPMAKVEPLMINGYPVFQFGYEGLLPLYKENDFEYLSMIRHYYYRATFDAYDFSKINTPVFKRAVIIFVHYFNTEMERDLDNRNKKYIQDAIRQTGIIGRDDWKHVWNMDIAFLDEERNHVQIYVTPTEKLIDFLSYLLENHEKLKENTKYLPKKEDYETEFLKSKTFLEHENSSKNNSQFFDQFY